MAQDGSGTLTLGGINSYSGGTEIDSGNLAFTSTSAIGGGTGNAKVTINQGGALDVPGPYPYNTAMGWLNSGAIDPSSTGALALIGGSDERVNMTGYDSLSLGTAVDCSYTGTLLNPDNNTCIFGGGGGTLTLPNALADVGGMATSVAIQGNVTFIATNMYSGTTTISAGALQLGDGTTSASFGTGDVVDNASLVFNCVDDTTIGDAIRGTGG